MAQERATPLELELLKGKLKSDFSQKIRGLGHDVTAKERNFLSKAIAAFVLHEEAGASIDEAVSSSIDGGQDHGIDSVFIDRNHTIWLIQSKYIDSGFGEPELGDVSKFRDGIKDLIEGKLERFNQEMRNREQEIKTVLDSGVCKIKVVLAYSGTAISDDRRCIFSDIEQAFNDTSPNFIRCYAYGLNTLHELHVACSSEQSIDAEIELVNFGHSQTPYKTFYGQMDAKIITELWKQNRHRLVEKNIRRFKGETGVNQSLLDTVENEPSHFFYFNNGITFLCDSIDETYPRDANRQRGKFKVKGLSIINGAQTVGVIGRKDVEYYQSHPTKVLATFLCLERASEDFGIKVTQARNRQNVVDLEDFASLDENQAILKNTLNLAGITYLIKQGDDDPPSCDNCFTIRELVPFLACTITGSDWQKYIIAAKSDKKKLFQQIGLVSHREKMQDAYQKIFPDSRTSKEIWRIVQMGRVISQMVRDRANGEPFDETKNLQSKDILREGVWLILHVIFLKSKLQYENAFDLTDDEKSLLSRYVDSVSQKLVDIIQSQTWDKSEQSIFENQSDCQTVKNSLMAKLAD